MGAHRAGRRKDRAGPLPLERGIVSEDAGPSGRPARVHSPCRPPTGMRDILSHTDHGSHGLGGETPALRSFLPAPQLQIPRRAGDLSRHPDNFLRTCCHLQVTSSTVRSGSATRAQPPLGPLTLSSGSSGKPLRVCALALVDPQ